VTPVVVRLAAAADVAEAYRWYEERRIGLGEEFLAAVDAAVGSAADNPQLYPVVHRDTRRVLLRRFPYGLYYRVLATRIVVVACFHAKRAPTAWRKRA
jgi:plasmid stabilization system protein ParE